MMYKRFILIALLTLTPALSHSVDVAAIKQEISGVITELENKSIPAAQQIAKYIQKGDFSAIQNYFARSNDQLIPAEALQFGRDNIGTVQQALESLLAVRIPTQVVDALNGLQSNVGTQLQSLQSQAASALKSVNLANYFDQAANVLGKINRGDAKNFALMLQKEYSKGKIDANALLNSANKLQNTLDPLKQVAMNLQKLGVLTTLNQLSTTLPQFIAGDEIVRADLIDNLLGLLTDLNDQAPQIKELINKFTPFVNELIAFTEQLYTVFGPALWNQIPAAEQNAAKQALKALQDNKAEIMNAINMVASKMRSVLQ